jgi:DNA-binding NtrC family response regulator
VKHARSKAKSPLRDPRPLAGGRVLLVEPDHLTMWSLVTYLQRWFTVESTHCGMEAEKLLRAQPLSAVIVSDQLPGRTAESLLQLAQTLQPPVRTVLMVTGEADAHTCAACSTRIEKPFELADLGRLLGIADGVRQP